MSRWTYVQGVMRLRASPFDRKKGKDGKERVSIPFPKEQMKVALDGVGVRFDEEGERKQKGGLDFRAYLCSLPRARKYIDAAFALLPQGEVGFRYSLSQDLTDGRSSCSAFYHECSEEAFREAVEEYCSENVDRIHRHGFKELEEYEGAALSWVEYVDGITVGIHRPLRYCSGLEFLESLEKAILRLESDGITVEDGYVEWTDAYQPEWIYAWRGGSSPSEAFSFMVLDSKTNAILWKKTYRRKRDANGGIMDREEGFDATVDVETIQPTEG